MVYVAVMGSSTAVCVVGSYGAASAPTQISKAMSPGLIGIAISHHDLVTGDAPGVSR
jgi:hypothetical protein